MPRIYKGRLPQFGRLQPPLSSVRFDASADRLLRTSDLPNYNSGYTWMAWVQLVTDLDAASTIFAMNDDSTNNADFLHTNGDGTTCRLAAYIGGTGTESGATNLTVGQWYHLCLLRADNNTLILYVNGVLSHQVTKDVAARTAATRMEIGARTSADTARADIRVTAIKFWTVTLSAAQIQAEVNVIPYKRADRLYGFWPCFPGSEERLRDYSGNRRDWTESGVLTSETPSRVVWSIPSTFVPFAVTATTTLPLLTANMKGNFRNPSGRFING